MGKPIQAKAATVGPEVPPMWKGGAPGTVAGVMQVNARVPDDITPNGAAQVMVIAGGASNQTSATVAIR